jgi:hypothetical protein
VRSKRVIVVAIALIAYLHGAASGQEPVVVYSYNQLHCARFLETAESKILTLAGGRTRNQTSTRRGVWQFRALPMRRDVALEGWLDSLTVTRRSEETAISPDTDGLLGGRYRGTLSARGIYTSRNRPFVPDEVAEVAGMHNALDDFFPPLPTRELREGEIWTDSKGLTIRRLPDSALSGVPLYRFQLERRGEARSAETPADTLPLRLQQKSSEQSEFVWHPHLGLLSRDRRIVVETTVPPSRSVYQAVRSKVEQRITLVRDLDPQSCRPGSGGE